MKLKDDQIYLGEHFLVTFQRTLRIPEDNNEYPLPPGLGSFPVRRVADFAANLPTSWSDDEEALFIPLYQQEALWLSFTAVHWKPNAVMIGIGEINALTGALWQPKLEEQPQNYLVCPEQPWLDGFKVDDSVIRQFVTVPLGQGLAISEQILGSATFGGLRLVVFEPKAGLFPKTLPAALEVEGKIPLLGAHLESVDSQSMGLGAGGKMKQKVYPDPFGINTWDTSHSESVTFISSIVANIEQLPTRLLLQHPFLHRPTPNLGCLGLNYMMRRQMLLRRLRFLKRLSRLRL